MHVEVSLPNGLPGTWFQTGFLQKLGPDAEKYGYVISGINFKLPGDDSVNAHEKNRIVVTADPADDQAVDRAARFSVELVHQYQDMDAEAQVGDKSMFVDSQTIQNMFANFGRAEALQKAAGYMRASATHLRNDAA